MERSQSGKDANEVTPQKGILKSMQGKIIRESHKEGQRKSTVVTGKKNKKKKEHSMKLNLLTILKEAKWFC